jgi:diguanylate cyclase (GGDEF)-like protein/PAS domain S-box-containing protein
MSKLQIVRRPGTKDSIECVLLIMADEENAARILGELGSPADERFKVERVMRLSSGIERLARQGVGAVMLDLTLPDSIGVETFDRILLAAPRVPIVILCEADTEELAKESVRRGAQDHLLKNQADGYRLRQAIRMMFDHRAAEGSLLENEASNLALESIGEAVLRTDIGGNVIFMNRMAEQMTGWSLAEVLGHSVKDVLRIIDGIGKESPNTMEIATKQDKAATTNRILVRRDGLRLEIENTVTTIHDHAGSVTGTVVAFHDVSAARARSLEMSHLAHYDPLTDLPNRMLFNDRLKQAISLGVRQGKRLAIMFVDIDHFKQINDSLGHGVGDTLLQSVARRLLSCVRRTDTVSRQGGDEFVVLLSQVEREEDAAFSAGKILRALAAPHTIDNKRIDITVSIGVSTYPTDGLNEEDLMEKADVAMYEAKQQGRNNYRFFRQEMHDRLADRQALEADLRYALGRKEFLLHYQPKFDLQSGKITGMEALIRWIHPLRGLVTPAQFVPLAEECGLILSIGRWVLLEACTQARAWSDSDLGVVPVAVNVSAAEFGDKDFLSGVRAALIATGVEPANLELELTESVLMDDAESAVDKLRALKAIGVQLAIDDFGTGFSSFTYLRRFPVDALKLDQSFVQEITEDQADATIISAMINIGNSLKRRVIAEGIETHAQLKFLQRHKCGEGQGYYFSRPVVAEHAGKLIEAGIRKNCEAPFAMH